MDFKKSFHLSDSMEGELIFLADELQCDEEMLLDAILLAYFWKNYDALKFLFDKGKKKS